MSKTELKKNRWTKMCRSISNDLQQFIGNRGSPIVVLRSFFVNFWRTYIMKLKTVMTGRNCSLRLRLTSIMKGFPLKEGVCSEGLKMPKNAEQLTPYKPYFYMINCIN